MYESSKYPHVLKSLWEDALAPVRIEVLQQAYSLGLLHKLNTASQLEELVILCQVDEKVLKYFLTLLWSMGIVNKMTEPDCYQLTGDYQMLFDPNSPSHFSDALFNRIQACQEYQIKIRDLCGIHDSSSWSNAKKTGTWQSAGLSHLAQDQKVLIAPLAEHLLDEYMPHNQPMHFLDLGGNPGNIAIHILKKHADATGVIFDLAETNDVIVTNLKETNTDDKIKVSTGIFPQDDIGSGYDLIWCSQLFYFINDVSLGLDKIYKALNKGGLLFFAHAEIPEDPQLARSVLPWYFRMYLHDMHLYSEGTWQEKLSQIGFRVLSDEYSYDFPLCPLKTIIAQK